MVFKSSRQIGNGGEGTVTEITAGNGLDASPNPITGAGTIFVADDTPNSLAGYDNTGEFSNVAVGSGLSLSGGTLTATGVDTGITQLTGDVTAGPGSGSQAATLATVNSNVGTFGTATQVAQITANAKGLATAVSNVAIAIPATQVTDFTEAAQDAVGAMVDTTLVYTDGGPTLGRAAISGDVTIASGSNVASISGLDATKIADGSVTNTEFQYLGGVTSDIQTQLNSKQATLTPAALTKVDDTNVTLTLGGTPSTALLQAASITAGWTGNLDVTRGGTGRNTGTTAYGLIAAGTTATGAQQTLAAGATTEILVGGGAAALPVWTTATGSGAPVRATSPTLSNPTVGTQALTNDSTLAASTEWVKNYLSEFASYTCTVVGGTNGLAYTNTTTTANFRRCGDRADIQISTAFSGAPATGTGVFSFPIPSVTIDNAKLPGSAAASSNIVGTAMFWDANTTTTYTGTVSFVDSNDTFQVNFHNTTTAASPTVPVTVASGDRLNLIISIPITL